MRPFLPFAIFFSMFASDPAFALAIPDCAGSVEIRHANIARVENNGVLVLSDGRALLLEGIRLPDATDRGPVHFAVEARDALAALAKATPITATAVPPKEDRYDRVRVQGFGDVWLQRALLERGLARVSIAPDRSECTTELYAAEGAARAAGRGVCGALAYRVRGFSDDWRADTGSFQLVEGRVARVSVRDEGTVLDFSADGRSGLSVLVPADDRSSFRRAGLTPDLLTGKRVQVRGIIEDAGGRPRIALASPGQIEILP